MHQEKVALVTPKSGADFVETPYVKKLAERALDYIRCGFPVHLSGPTGVGKTTLALHIAARLGRPMVLICGDHEFGTSDLVGSISGYRQRYMRDNFIRSVLKTEEVMTSQWVDNRLTVACKDGFTLVYDEFTRSRPEANNVFLSVLEGRILPLPRANGGEEYVKVHPDFSAIFTSNPEEYAGVYKTQDALRDRLVTIGLDNFDEDTEVAITQARSKVSSEDARRIVHLMRKVRQIHSDHLMPTVRACIKIAKILNLHGERACGESELFREVCEDVILPAVHKEERASISRVIKEVISEFE